LLVFIARRQKIIKFDFRVSLVECGHHKFIAAILDTRNISHRIVQKLECLERRLRVVSIVKKLQRDGCDVWMDVALVERVKLPGFWRVA